MKNYNDGGAGKFMATVFIIWGLWVLLWLGVVAALIGVAWHFIAKFW